MHIPGPTMDLLSHFADGIPKSVVKSYPGDGEDMASLRMATLATESPSVP